MGNATVRRFPTFEIELITEDTSYELVYDTKKQLNSKDFEEALLTFSTKNDMTDDTPVFSMVLAGKDKWDKVLNANDLVIIRVIPDVTKPEPDNPYIMVGLISDIHKEGEYGDGTLLYRITGQAMSKALINFEVGVIQEVATIIPSIGWLPDGTEHGLNFSGNTASGIADELMNRFVYRYAEYKFANGKGLSDYLTHTFSSWVEDELLADPTPFVNYQGSLRQFLEDIAAKPFNELFFEFTRDGQCKAYMRPTPFDHDMWYHLQDITITSDIVVEESFGKSDSEVYSVFVVNVPMLIEFTSMDLGVFPKYHPELIKKYGYKRLDAENRYLLTFDPRDSSTPGEGPRDASVITTEGNNMGAGQGGVSTFNQQTPDYPTYSEVAGYIADNDLQNAEKLRTQRNEVVTNLLTRFPMLTQPTINTIVDQLQTGNFTQESYEQLIENNYGVAPGGMTVEEKQAARAKLEKFTQRLYNWYCENGNFYSGDIRVLGDPAFRLGTRLYYEDFEQETVWEFYIESVQHEFSFTNGYTTVLGVTRGLPNRGRDRFTNLYGKSEDFKGGYFGEMSLEQLMEEGRKAHSISDGLTPVGWGGGFGGSGVAAAAMNTALQQVNRPSRYVFGGGRSGSNPFNSTPIVTDCSSFVWWCYKVNGVELNGGATGMTTDTIKRDSRLTVVSPRGASKTQAASLMQPGDIIYWDTYKADGHIGIYIGDGKFVGSQTNKGISIESMTSGYWWDKFNGHVLRFGGSIQYV